jgi:hypothetical protein
MPRNITDSETAEAPGGHRILGPDDALSTPQQSRVELDIPATASSALGQPSYLYSDTGRLFSSRDVKTTPAQRQRMLDWYRGVLSRRYPGVVFVDADDDAPDPGA